MPWVLNKRTEKMPADAVYVGRPTKWGNPFKTKTEDGFRTNEEVVALYKAWINTRPDLIEAAKKELKGKHLVCWCYPKPCHADVLIEIANERSPEE